jgi:hypothetical protein
LRIRSCRADRFARLHIRYPFAVASMACRVIN